MKPDQALKAALIGSAAPELLDDAARHAAARRATVRTRHLDPPAVAPEQEPHQPPQAFVSTLNAVLARPPAARDPLLVDALLLLGRQGRVLPPRLLVPLLEVARWNREVTSALLPVLGARGRWLAELNPDWLRGRAVAEPKPADWTEGTLAERVAWVRHVRRTDPDAGRALVVEARKERAADRAQLVEALEVSLGLADEELLEELLRDRSKEVGRLAAGLLARLDGSAYLERAVTLARTCFTRIETPAQGLLGKLRRGTTTSIVGVAPPEKDSTADHHGAVAGVVVPKGPAGRLVALAGVVPPHRWADVGVNITELDPGVLLDDERVPVAEALIEAVVRWKNVEAARALLTQHADPGLVLLLPPAERDATLERVIRAATEDRAATGTGFATLCDQLDSHPGLRLTPGAARGILDGMAACLTHKRPVPPAASHLVAHGADAAEAASLVPRLTDLAGHADVTQQARIHLRDAAATLTFRQSIHESLKEPR